MESSVSLMKAFNSKAECKRKHVQLQAVTKMSEDRGSAMTESPLLYTKYAYKQGYQARKQLEDIIHGMAAAYLYLAY